MLKILNRKHDESIPNRPKPEREERQRTEGNGFRFNQQNGAGNFFNGVCSRVYAFLTDTLQK